MRRDSRAVLALTALSLIVPLWTDATWAQTKVLRVGVLTVSWSEQADLPVPRWIVPFYRTLREHGWVEGKNVVFEYRDAAGDPTRLAEPAAELVRLKVDVLFPVGRRLCAPPSRQHETFQSSLTILRPIRWPRATPRATAILAETSPGSSLTPRSWRANGSNYSRP